MQFTHDLSILLNFCANGDNQSQLQMHILDYRRISGSNLQSPEHNTDDSVRCEHILRKFRKVFSQKN